MRPEPANKRTNRNRPGPTAVMGLLVLAIGTWGCAEDPLVSDPLEPLMGYVTLDGTPFAGAMVKLTYGGMSFSGLSGSMGEYEVMIPGNKDYRVRTNVTALCPEEEIHLGAMAPGAYELDVPCFLPQGEVDGTFTVQPNNCGLPTGNPIGVTLTIRPTITGGETDGKVTLEFSTTTGFAVTGEYDPLTREYSGSSEETTDPNGITASETWTATVDFGFGSKLARLIGTSTATFVDQSTGGSCETPAELLILIEPTVVTGN